MCGLSVTVVIVVILAVQLVLCQKYVNNVCKTVADYYLDMKNNPNCYHNPDVYLSVVSFNSQLNSRRQIITPLLLLILTENMCNVIIV